MKIAGAQEITSRPKEARAGTYALTIRLLLCFRWSFNLTLFKRRFPRKDPMNRRREEDMPQETLNIWEPTTLSEIRTGLHRAGAVKRNGNTIGDMRLYLRFLH